MKAAAPAPQNTMSTIAATHISGCNDFPACISMLLPLFQNKSKKSPAAQGFVIAPAVAFYLAIRDPEISMNT
jgi:hypothetical protein